MGPQKAKQHKTRWNGNCHYNSRYSSSPAIYGKEIQVFDCLPCLSTISLKHDINFSAILFFNCPDNIPENSIKHGTICSVIAVGLSWLFLVGVVPGAKLIVYQMAEENTFYVKAILETLKDIQYKRKNKMEWNI